MAAHVRRGATPIQLTRARYAGRAPPDTVYAIYARSLAIDRNTINQAETLRFSRRTTTPIRDSLEYAWQPPLPIRSTPRGR
jgi:hypothetical protein